MSVPNTFSVIPAKAGIQANIILKKASWIPPLEPQAGMTDVSAYPKPASSKPCQARKQK